MLGRCHWVRNSLPAVALSALCTAVFYLPPVLGYRSAQALDTSASETQAGDSQPDNAQQSSGVTETSGEPRRQLENTEAALQKLKQSAAADAQAEATDESIQSVPLATEMQTEAHA